MYVKTLHWADNFMYIKGCAHELLHKRCSLPPLSTDLQASPGGACRCVERGGREHLSLLATKLWPVNYGHTSMVTTKTTCIHTHTHTYIHTYRQTDIHTSIHTCIHAHIYTYIHTYLPTYIHTYIHTLPMDCQWIANGLPMDCPWMDKGLLMDCQWIANGLPMD